MTEQSNAYDEVPYESLPIAVSHPLRMATTAHLMGLRPVPLDQCRVLEIGCSMGGNIIPMAVNFPKSEFVGIDYSAVQIERGLPTIAALNLKNIILKAVNVLDITPDFGQFDYIIAHGVYSWVPQVVREKIMEVCARNLSPRGIAYVSYNTYPGWHMLRSIREMMLYHSNKFSTPQKRVEQARALLDYLASHTDSERSAYGIMLKNEVDRLRQSPDYYLLHEHLETVNEPLYFHQFVEHATRHDLQYVGDTQFSAMVVPNLSSFVTDTLRKVTTDRIEMEQYVDFLRNGTFRRSLLTHRAATVRSEVELARAKELFVNSSARPVAPAPDVASDRGEDFRTDEGVSGSTANRITKAAMMVMSEHYPQPLHFEKLLRLARKKLPKAYAADPNDEDLLAADLLGAGTMNLVQMHAFAVPVQMEVAPRPRVGVLTRHQAPQGWVTSHFHARISLDEFTGYLLTLLDGTRDRKALYRDMLDVARQGKITMAANGVAVLEEGALRNAVQQSVDNALDKLVRMALLI